MNYFIFGYVETVLTESLKVSNITPTALIGDALPADNDTGAAVAGQIYWNDLDTVNGNSYVYSPTKQCLIANADSTNPCTVTVQSVDDTINGLDRVVENFPVVVAAGELGIIPRLPAVFNDGGLVKLAITGTGAAATKIAVLNIV